MPRCWLHIAVRLAERCRRHEAASFLEGAAPELALKNIVVANVGDALRGSAILQQHEAPTPDADFAVPIGALTHDGSCPTGENRRQRLLRGGTIVRHAKHACDHVSVLVQRVEVAHWPRTSALAARHFSKRPALLLMASIASMIDDAWKVVVANRWRVLCPSCFNAEAEKAGGYRRSRLRSGGIRPFHVEA